MGQEVVRFFNSILVLGHPLRRFKRMRKVSFNQKGKISFLWCLIVVFFVFASLCHNSFGKENGGLQSSNTVTGPLDSKYLRNVPPEVFKHQNGLTMFDHTEGKFVFMPWESEQTAKQAIRRLKKNNGGVIYFSPGEYVVRRNGILIFGISNLSLVAVPGVRLVFPPPGDEVVARVLRCVESGEQEIFVDSSCALHSDWRYQIYSANGRHRLLEFFIAKIEDNKIYLKSPARIMNSLSSIPKGSQILENLNFFVIAGSNDIRIEGFEFDGRNRGNVSGHTIYCGILVMNNFHRARELGGPHFQNISIRNNVFKNFSGRGFAAYGAGNVVCQNNRFENIQAQAIEIDHYSYGRVSRNSIYGSTVAVVLNDAFNTLVEENLITKCRYGISFVSHFNESWVNTKNVVRNNTFIGPGERGVRLSAKSWYNIVEKNKFINIKRPIIDDGMHNRISDNEID